MSSSTDDGPMTGPKHHPQQPFNVAACTACFRLQAPIKTQRKGQQYSQMRTIECSQATKKGHANVGEKRTHETHSVCPSLSPEAMVYLHSPRVFQSLMVLSRDPETIWRFDGEGDRENVLFVSNKATRGLSRVDFPETESAVPSSTQGELSVTANDDIRHKVGASAEGTTSDERIRKRRLRQSE